MMLDLIKSAVMDRLWVDAEIRHGGEVTVVHLPEISIHGTTNYPFSDLNNVAVAAVVSKFLKEKRLD